MRPDQEIIARWIEPGSRVLDLGCGDGALLASLRGQKGVRAIGLEIDSANIERCLGAGVAVIEQNLNGGLSNFDSDSFDTVLLAQTLQALANPAELVEEMLRIGRNLLDAGARPLEAPPRAQGGGTRTGWAGGHRDRQHRVPAAPSPAGRAACRPLDRTPRSRSAPRRAMDRRVIDSHQPVTRSSVTRSSFPLSIHLPATLESQLSPFVK